jgi:hypothetical protein
LDEERAAVVAKAAEGIEKIWGEALDSAQQTLGSNGVSMLNSDVMVSDMLTFDSESRKFVGGDAEKANSFLSREYRSKEFTVPEIEI